MLSSLFQLVILSVSSGELIHPNDCTYKVYNTTHCSYKEDLATAQCSKFVTKCTPA